MLVVQRIVIRWGRRRRGAADRELRARLPRALPLPPAALAANTGCIRHFVTHARVGSKPTELVEADSLLCVRRTGGCSIALREVDGLLEVSFGPGDEGTPRRPAPPKLMLSPGTWGRVRYNGRFAGFDEPWYEEKTVNLAYQVAPTRKLFTHTQPTALLDAQVDLW